MSAIITEKFRLHNAEQFFESFTEESPSTYYFFIGKQSPYIDADNYGYTASDNVPPAPRDDVQTEYYKWDSMLAAKLISSADVSYVIPRVDWKENTVFDMYEHDVRPIQGTDTVGNLTANGSNNLWNSSFYFITDEYKVYKVLSNNGGTQYDGGVQYSGVKPESTSTIPFFLGGYYLKYMYTLSTTQVEKFLTTDFMPVSTDSAVSQAAIDNAGSIEVVRVVAGSGYNNGTYYSAIKGDGSGAVVEIVVNGGQIMPFGDGNVNGNTSVQSIGGGYTYAYIDLNDVYSDSGLTTQANIGVSTDGGLTGGTGGVVEAIIPPKNGHGYNAIEELGGHFVMMNARLEQSEGDDLTVANDFREVGIVVNPTNYGTTTISTAVTRRQSFAVRFLTAPTTDYIIDEKITQATTGAVGRVVEWDSNNNILYYVQERHPDYGIDSNSNYVAFSGSNAITGTDSGASAIPSAETISGDGNTSITITLSGGNDIDFTNGGYCLPELQPDSGKIIYVENRRPISRAPDQTEDIKIIIEF